MAEQSAYDDRYKVVPEPAGTLDELLPHYVKDFIAAERKSEELLRELLLRGNYRIFTVRSRETGLCAAYLMGYLVDGARYFFLDFFAVDPAFRGGGLGGWTLRALSGVLGVDGLFFELEIPAEDAGSDDQNVRRIGFYERLGARRLPIDYGLLLTDGTLFPMYFYFLPFTEAKPERISVEEAVMVAYEYTYGIMPAAYPGWRMTLASILGSLA